MYRTSKCNHGEKGMCIHCLVNKNRQGSKQVGQTEKKEFTCKHPPHMKCLRCLPKEEGKKMCNHPDYEKCKRCEWLIRYEKFSHYLEALTMDCSHKKPCEKCVPPLSRKNYFIYKQCKRHIPYPQALCDACMAPTLTIAPQKYTHVSKVVIRTTSIYRIVDAKMFGILLGRVKEDVVTIEDVYFPAQQEPSSEYINPQMLEDNRHIWDYMNLREVGILYHSDQITGLGLMISSLFQEKYLEFEGGHQFSKFITMRLHLASGEGEDPHFQCFMVSDQLQAFHRNGIIFEKSSQDNYFDLITARAEQNSELPTFLREGIETDKIFFKEALVWIPTVSQQSYLFEHGSLTYPFYTLDQQDFQNLKGYILMSGDPLEKYRNIQFLLHLQRLIGRQSMIWFINNYLPFDPDLFLHQKLAILEKIQVQKLKMAGGHRYYDRHMM